MFKSFFSKQLHIARLRSGYTQTEVADKVGISVRWYQRIESGYSVPGGELVIKLIILLDMDLSEFKNHLYK